LVKRLRHNYPTKNIPDSVAVSSDSRVITIEFDFKNTSDSDALSWYHNSKESKIINKFTKEYTIMVTSSQDGNYEDDWQKLTVTLIKILPSVGSEEEPTLETIKSDDTTFSYTYILSTQSQKESINLVVEYKEQLEAIATEYLQSQLISIEVQTDRYTLTLSSILTVGQKRRLGKLISTNTNLKQYVKKVAYNGSQDTSGQLFVIAKGV
jgi:hypothetical protein